MPTAWPRAESASARLRTIVDLPTPPFPLATATTARAGDSRSTSSRIACSMEGVARVAALLALVLTGVASGAVADVPSSGRSAGELAVDRLAQWGVTVYCGGRDSRL